MKTKSQQLDYWQIRTLTAEGNLKSCKRQYWIILMILIFILTLRGLRMSGRGRRYKLIKENGDDKSIWKKK